MTYSTPVPNAQTPYPNSVKLDKSRLQLFVDICTNNLMVIAVNLVGALSFGIVTVMATAYNGFVFGRLLAFTFDFFGWSSFVSNLLPHMTEIIAIVLSCAIGLAAAFDLGSYMRNESHKRDVVPAKYLAQVSICAVVVIFSAFMEAYVSIE
jgi:uncharacterized membrane protein SpoIIM required for sporulation